MESKELVEVACYHPDGNLWVRGFSKSGSLADVDGLHLWFGQSWYVIGRGFAEFQQYKEGNANGVRVELMN